MLLHLNDRVIRLWAHVRQIPGLIHLEVGFDFSKKESSSDIVLYSEFDSVEHLDAYVIHPKHVAVGPIVRGATCERRMIDYTI